MFRAPWLLLILAPAFVGVPGGVPQDGGLDELLATSPAPTLEDLLERLGPAPPLEELLQPLPSDRVPLLRLEPSPGAAQRIDGAWEDARRAARVGDGPGVEAATTRVLDGLRASLPPRHPRLIDARIMAAEARALAAMDEHGREAVSTARLAHAGTGELLRAGKVQEARDLLLEALSERRRTFGRLDAEGLGLLGSLSVLLYQAGDPLGAERVARVVLGAALQRYGRLHPQTSSAIANLAFFLTARRAFAPAESLHAHGIDVHRRLRGDRDGTFAGRLFNLGQLYRDSDRLAAARDLFQRVLELREATGASPADLGMALSQLGYVWMKLGQFDRAQADISRALEWFDQGLPADHHERAQALEHLAVVEGRRGHFASAIELGGRATDMYARLFPGGHVYRGHSAMSLAKTLEGAGKLDAAEGRVREALESFSGLPTAHAFRLEARSALVSILSQRGELREARALMERNLESRREVFGARARVIADDLADLAEVEFALGRIPLALERAREECSILVELLGPTRDRTLSARLRRARMLLESGDPGGARAAWNELSGDVRPLQASALLQTRAALLEGRLLMAEGQAAAALPRLRAALAPLQGIAPEHPALVEVRYELGSALLASGASVEATVHLERALALCEDQRDRVLGDERARALYAARLSMDQVARTLVRAQVAAGDPGAALFAAERGRNRALLDLLQRSGGGRADDPALAPLLEDERAARRTEAQAMQDLRRARSRSGVTQADEERRIEALATARRALAEARRAVAGRLGTLWPASAAARPEAILAGLEPGDLLLHYTSDDQALVLLWARAGGRLRAELPASGPEQVAAFKARLSPVLADLRSGAPLGEQALATISNLLLPGDGLGDSKRVVVVPDGPLHGLPFEVLDLGGRPCVYRPSASIATGFIATGSTPRPSPPPGPKRAVLLGDPRFKSSDRTGATARAPHLDDFSDLDAFRIFGAALRPLPGSAAEVDAVARRLGAAGFELTILKGAEANEPRLFRDAPGARILHLATHGFRAQAERPYESALALATTANYTDGFLTLDELVRTWGERLVGCELVTLSACDTQVGTPHGASLVSLPWGFFHGGARRVLVSLWKVDDRATLLLMDRFYGNWLEPERHLSPEAALAEARTWLAGRTAEQNRVRLEALGVKGERAGDRSPQDGFPRPGADPKSTARGERFDFSHPRYWAAFVLYDAGD
jgi:tetratricopeptide (TPR) repeat protein